MTLIRPCVLLCLFGLLLPLTLLARNVDLATVPERRTVQLTIYNSEDLTLVGKPGGDLQTGHQSLVVLPGQHPDRPNSVDLRFREPKPGWKYSIPPSRTTSRKPCTGTCGDADREATIEISYFTSGELGRRTITGHRRSR